MKVTIREHTPGDDVRPFIRAGHEVFRADPVWVPPLDLEFRDRLDPKKNPFFQRADVALFTAWRGRRLVGRCSAQVDRGHLRVWNDDTGFFGFFDTIDDEEAGRALIDAAATWLRRRGMKRMRGPMSLHVNEEVGILIDGFAAPPVIFMAHSRPHQARIAEAAGLAKAKDLIAWRYDAGEFPARAIKAWENVKAMPEVRLRSVEMRHLEREIEDIMDVYNDAWEGKWGVVPPTRAEVAKIAADLRLILDEDLAFVAEIDGRTVAICIMLPNVNEALAGLRGRLLPTGALRLVWRMKVRHPVSTRLVLLGIRKELRHVKRYGALSAAMYVEVAKRGIAKGYRWGELSWTREDDHPINLGIRAMGAIPYKRYRVFEKTIAS